MKAKDVIVGISFHGEDIFFHVKNEKLGEKIPTLRISRYDGVNEVDFCYEATTDKDMLLAISVMFKTASEWV
jgi:hypothetical protein